MIVIGNWFSNDVSLFLGYNNGTWGTKIFLSTGANLYSIATGDLNNDNNFDILVGHNGASSAVQDLDHIQSSLAISMAIIVWTLLLPTMVATVWRLF
ncbi:unnamed protein product [Rotaria magnacalcarata]|uniref:Uncharacterized protein n=1 Tax=Rotaria magnacalcarata TaxID=392030 RepID=A0A819G7P3_9BILA|nr:unnamed protein product [Rotaria magnacalcarata]CAF3881108.1 unnamed protein product [Rotaria magnacalcarata]CAF3959747.1 unnamed protein product [Rotaria magnacalcarata]